MGSGFNPFGDMFNMFGGQQKRRGAPEKVIDIMVTTIESYLGSDKEILYKRKHMCGDCNGSGGERNHCNVCNGSGVVVQKMSNGMMVQMIQTVCNHCNGKGFVYIKTCNTCRGNCSVEKNENIKIKLPHGIDDGQFLRLQGKGDFHNGIYGNLVVRIKVTPENNFEKFGNDLIYNKFLNLDDIKKESFILPHPNGELSVKFPLIFDSSVPLRVKSKGFNGGELYIKLFVKFTR
jgi:molecular chaperone DnaJ